MTIKLVKPVEEPEDTFAKLRRCRAMATELRCLLEEVRQDQGGITDFDYEVEDHAVMAGEIEDWLDHLQINEDGTAAIGAEESDAEHLDACADLAGISDDFERDA